jgi:hypothetical protein
VELSSPRFLVRRLPLSESAFCFQFIRKSVQPFRAFGLSGYLQANRAVSDYRYGGFQ